MKKFFTHYLSVLLIALTAFISMNASGQSILNPSDSVVTYDTAATVGSVSNPNQPALGSIGKWIRTVRVSFNTSSWKCYIINGIPFRLKFPKSYTTDADGKKYPMLVFFHGAGEIGAATDNELSLANGGQFFTNSVDNGLFDGFVLVPQTPANGWGPTHFDDVVAIIKYMVINNKLDLFKVAVNGLSAGGGGTWNMLARYPQYISAALPISAMSILTGTTASINVFKFTRIWDFQGGLDTSPDPYTTNQVNANIWALGGNYRYTVYPTIGHGIWNTVWKESNFWPYIDSSYASNPWTLFGQTEFCPGVSVNVTIGVAPGYDSYQWRKDGVLISSATTDSIVVTSYGTYDCRVLNGTNWSDWSHLPAVIKVKEATVTPPITISGLMSDVIPAVDNAGVTLQVPATYASYIWQKVGDSTTLSSANTLNVTTPGNYIVKVTEQYGCSSSFGNPFKVVDATGPNKPDAAANLIATALSPTSVLLNWSQNPTPVNNETNFEIYQGSKAGGPYKLVALTGPDASKDTLSGLAAGTDYYYVIRAVDSTGAAAVSAEASAKTVADVLAPTAPGALTIVSTTPNSVSLSWTGSTDNVGVISYDIYVNGVRSYSVPATQTTFAIYSLVHGQSYTFFVKATDAAPNASPASNQVSALVIANGLVYKYYDSLSTSLTVLPNYGSLTPVVTGGMKNVSIASATDATWYSFLWTGYLVIRTAGDYTLQTTSDDASRLWLGAKNSIDSPYSFSGTPLINNDKIHSSASVASAVQTLQPGIYPIAIAYMNATGGASMALKWKTPGSSTFVAVPDSAFVEAVTAGGTAPAIPTNGVATAQSYNTINVSWADNSNNETGFEVYRSTSIAGSYSIIGTAPAQATSYKDSGLEASTSYYYKVQAINTYGASGFDSLSFNGLHYKYYSSFTASSLVTLPDLTPASTGVVSNITLTPASATTYYAFLYSGYITIKTAGSYTFYTSSDDGSNLYIGGYDSAHLVVKNDGAHGTTEKSGTLTLAAGRYPFYVSYLQLSGSAVLTASYKLGSGTKTTLPDSLFYGVPVTAKTPALPAVPTTPSSLTATALSTSAINLHWTDSAVNETSYQVYRSNNDNQNYFLLATLPANSSSFKDTALFTSAKYYYKVAALNAGGTSAYSNEVHTSTLGVPPVISDLANQQARYGATTTIQLSATTTLSSAVTFSGSNLPAFAQLTDNHNNTGVLTLTPAAANAGTYSGISIIATDSLGAADTTTFNLVVNDNYAPTLDTVSSYTINEGDSVSISLAGHDANSTDTLTLTAINLPAGYTLTQSAGTGVLVLHPGYAASGTYNAQVTVSDGRGLSATRSFVVTVKDKDPSSKVYVRFSAGDAVGAPWNSLTGNVTSNLLDNLGNTTAVGFTVAPTWWYATSANGPTTGNNSGVVPDAVMKDYYYFGAAWVGDVVSAYWWGLDTSKTYNVTVFASSIYDGTTDNGSTSFTVGSQSVTIHVQNNQTNAPTLAGIKPASDGTIQIQMARLGSAPSGLVNAMILSSVYDDGTAPATATNLVAQKSGSGSSVSLSWTDLAYNETSYVLYRSKGDSLSFTELTTLPLNSVAYTDTATSGNTTYYYRVVAANAHGVSSNSNTASVLTPDRVPVVTAISDVTVSNTQTKEVTVTAVDDPTDHLTLTASGLPSFATFTDNGDGTGTISIQPTAGLQGTFAGVTITATDMADSSSVTSFNINVVDPNLTYTYVNFTNSSFLAPAPWNNFLIPYLPYATMNASNLVDQTGAATGMTVTLTNTWDKLGYSGMKRRNGSDLYPENVSYNSLFTSESTNHQVTITGMNPNKKYNIQFFMSHNTSESSLTNFTINGQTISMNGSQNSNKTVQLNGLMSDASGTMVVNIQKDTSATYGLLSSLVIESYDSSSSATAPFSPGDLRTLDYAQSNTIALQWQDRADNETGYEIWRANDGGSYSLLTTLPANTTAYVDSSLPSNTAYDYVVRAVKASGASVYSNPVKGYTYASTVFINMNNSSSPNPGAPFNSLNWLYRSLGTVWNNFKDETGAVSNIGMIQPTNWDEVETNGWVAGNATGNYPKQAGIFPDKAVIQSFLNFVGNTSYLTVTGLDMSKTYDFTLFGSCADDNTQNSTSRYTINGKSSLLNAHFNNSGTVTMFGIVPDENGSVNITVDAYDSSNSSFSMLGILIIKGYTPTINGVVAAPASTQVITTAIGTTANRFSNTDSAQNIQPLKAYPNPFNDYFDLSVPAQQGENVVVQMVDAGGRTMYMQTFENLMDGSNLLRIQPGTRTTSGFYFVRVIYVKQGQQKTLKVIKR